MDVVGEATHMKRDYSHPLCSQYRSFCGFSFVIIVVVISFTRTITCSTTNATGSLDAGEYDVVVVVVVVVVEGKSSIICIWRHLDV